MLALRPTFSESWYRVASLRVRLRPGAQITRQFYRGEKWYVVRDPAGSQYLRLSDGAYRLIGLLDGKRTVADAWELAGGQMDDAAPTQPEVIQILSQLHASNLIEADITPDAQVLLRRHKAMQRQQWKQRAMNVLFPRIPLPFDLNGIVTRWMPGANLLFSTAGTILWLVVVSAAIVTLVPSWAELGKQSQSALSYNNWGYLWAVFVLTKVIHEFGHAFACRKFGGEVHEMGIMFLVFIPTPYVDASTAWSFPSRWQRLFVGAAGMFTELFFAALMAFVWKVTSPETHPIINGMAYNAMLVAGVSTVLFNANPLLRYDGYYMLSDFLEIPNLQQKSREYGYGLIKRHIFRIKQQQPLPPIKQRAWMFLFWIASSIYRVFIGLVIILMVADRVPILGTLMMLGGVVTWLVVPIFTLTRYLTTDPELHRKRTLGWGFALGTAALAFALVGWVPVPVWIWSEAIIQPQQRQVLRAEYDGFVESINAVDQQQVQKGQIILQLENPTLEMMLKQAEAKLAGSELRRTLAISTDQAQRMIEEENIHTYQKRVAQLQGYKNDLAIRAEFDGLLIAPTLSQMKGQYLKHGGQEFAIIATLDTLEAKAPVDQADSRVAEPLRHRGMTVSADTPDKQTELRLAGDIDMRIHPIGMQVPSSTQTQLPHPALGAAGGGTIQTDPSDKQGVKPISEPFEVVMLLDNRSRQIVPGQRAYVRFTVGTAPLFDQAWRKLMNLLQLQNLNAKWS